MCTKHVTGAYIYSIITNIHFVDVLLSEVHNERNTLHVNLNAFYEIDTF